MKTFNEFLSELKTPTLLSYTQKAANKLAFHGDGSKKAQNRATGVKRAAARLTRRSMDPTGEFGYNKNVKQEEVELDERLGGKGYSRKAAASSVYPGKKGTGDWPESDRGEGNKARTTAIKKGIKGVKPVEKKSPTYLAHVHNKESAVLDANKKISSKEERDKLKKEYDVLTKRANLMKKHGSGYHPFLHREEGEVNEGKLRRKIKVGLRLAKREAERLVVDDPGGAYTYGSLGNPKPGDKARRDKERAAKKKSVKEGVMKFVKSIGRKKSTKKAEMDPTTQKLHDWRKKHSDKQKEHEKYVNFMPHDAHHESADAFELVRKKLEKEHGKENIITKDNPIKPQSAADKAKARAHQAKVDAENAAERRKDPSQGRYPKG